MRDVGGVHAGLFQQRLDRGGNDFRIALVADPALFPAIIELFALAAEVIDEIQRLANGCRGTSR